MNLYEIRKKLNTGIPISMIKLRVTDYSRVSTDHIEQKKSLKNQIEHFDEMIKQNKNWTYVPGYVDEGISGTTDLKRNNFMKMIEDARNEKFDLIITKEISRFSRNTLDSIKYTRELLSYGVAVLFINDNINTALPDSELRLTIMASMAQDEIRRLSERVKFGMNRAILNGNILGNNHLYGYKKNKKTGNLIIIEKEAQIVKKIFESYAINKMSLNEIAKSLNNNEIKTSQNKHWSATTLSRMISNVKYKGFYCGKKTEIIDYITKKVEYKNKDDWIIYKDYQKIPPIVSKYLWERANIRLEKRKYKQKEKKSYQCKYPLSSKIYCQNDNYLFHRRKQCKTSDDITWVCSNRLKNGKKSCHSANIRESEIYTIFSDLINLLKIELTTSIDILTKIYQKNATNNDKNLKLKEKNSLKYNNITNKILNEKIKEKKFLEKLIILLLNKITVSIINDDENKIKLHIFLNFSKEYLNESPIIKKEYQFKRGYNTSKTKRYTVKYFVFFNSS